MTARVVICVMCAIVCIAGCTTQTEDVNPNRADDFGMGLDSRDFLAVCQKMAKSLTDLPLIQNAKTPPAVAFVKVQNRSSEYIDGDAFLGKMRTELMKNSGSRIVWLDRAIAREIVNENDMKLGGLVTSTRKETLHGADLFLTGTIDSIDKAAGGERSTYFRLSFRLTNAGTSVVVWEHDYEVKKYAKAGLMYR